MPLCKIIDMVVLDFLFRAPVCGLNQTEAQPRIVYEADALEMSVSQTTDLRIDKLLMELKQRLQHTGDAVSPLLNDGIEKTRNVSPSASADAPSLISFALTVSS